MEVGHIHAPEGSIFPETLPRFCTLAWCVSGQFPFSGRGWSLPAQAGQVAAIGPGQYFSTDAQKDGCEAYYLLMDGPGMEELIAKNRTLDRRIPLSQRAHHLAGISGSEHP